MFLAAFLLLMLGCADRLSRSLTSPDALDTVDQSAPFLKVHMRDGSLYVLSDWTVSESEAVVTGTGTRYGVDRLVIGTGAFSVAVADVAIFETNVLRPSPSIAALTVITGISVAITVACITNPKACFGSCPTFYVTDGEQDLLQAEGFSASIAPSLEATDIDHLYRAAPRGREVTVQMLNEAYETHVVRRVDLLAVPRLGDRRVFQDLDGGFWYVTPPVAPTVCQASEGDCRDVLAAFDGHERRSLADSTDLALREAIELTFERTSDSPALVLASRQSLLPTYLLYQAFGYLGSTVAHWLALLERSDAASLEAVRGVVATLGGIDVLVQGSDGGWELVATISETGPLAADVKIVRLPPGEGPVMVRLEMAMGAWRIDWVALASVQEAAEPLRITPSEVRIGERSTQEALEKLLNDEQTLVAFPGDRHTILYRLPQDAENYELFLETRGYYLEWMREEWLAEENHLYAAGMFLDPAGTLKRLAPEFKRVEAQLDSAFWRSKYAH